MIVLLLVKIPARVASRAFVVAEIERSSEQWRILQQATRLPVTNVPLGQGLLRLQTPTPIEQKVESTLPKA
jgi:hypothetical protein